MTAARQRDAKSPSDDELVRRSCDGDRRAFTEIYHRYAAYVAKIVFHTLGTDLYTDDLVQDTFATTFRSLSSLDDGSKLKSWIGTVAVRLARQKIRKISRERSFRARLTTFSDVFSKKRATQSHLDEIERNLAKLPEKLRTPWVLQRLAGHEIREVAELCEVSEATVKRRIAAAEERLRKDLEQT